MPPRQKVRLDALLVQRGLTESRARAQSIILAGAVLVNGQKVTKSGTNVPTDVNIELLRDPNPYVSRGGLKLAAALDAFEYDPTGLVALDIGASTGGFTDCLLQHGANHIYAVDVGYGQFAWSLRQDPRVTLFERTNARYLTSETIPERCNLAVIDVNHISLTKVVPAISLLLEPPADLIVLVKPQFEGERSQVGKGGVVRDPRVRQSIVDLTVARLCKLGLQELHRLDSPVHGPKGNIECLVWLKITN